MKKIKLLNHPHKVGEFSVCDLFGIPKNHTFGNKMMIEVLRVGNGNLSESCVIEFLKKSGCNVVTKRTKKEEKYFDCWVDATPAELRKLSRDVDKKHPKRSVHFLYTGNTNKSDNTRATRAAKIYGLLKINKKSGYLVCRYIKEKGLLYWFPVKSLLQYFKKGMLDGSAKIAVGQLNEKFNLDIPLWQDCDN